LIVYGTVVLVVDHIGVAVSSVVVLVAELVIVAIQAVTVVGAVVGRNRCLVVCVGFTRDFALVLKPVGYYLLRNAF